MSDKPARAIKLNVINEPKDSYTGGPSSLCPGCGHDQISNVIVNAAWENGIKPHRIAKMSGIGCSSKTPAYYLGQSHGFNTVHGRMPSVTTGAYAINKDLLYLGVSGDGDSASIGIGQLIHAIRRNMDMVYIVENNGVYGLTKGQYSATADIGSKKKKGKANETQPIDLCALAINLGCTFVARSFSGSKKQLTSPSRLLCRTRDSLLSTSSLLVSLSTTTMSQCALTNMSRKTKSRSIWLITSHISSLWLKLKFLKDTLRTSPCTMVQRFDLKPFQTITTPVIQWLH